MPSKRCDNERCRQYTEDNVQFCKSCMESLEDSHNSIVVCTQCGKEYLIRRRLAGEIDREIGICSICKIEIDRRKKE